MTRFVCDFLRHDGVFLLRMISQNAGDIIASQVTANLWTLYKKKYSRRGFRGDLNNTRDSMSVPLEHGGQSMPLYSRSRTSSIAQNQMDYRTRFPSNQEETTPLDCKPTREKAPPLASAPMNLNGYPNHYQHPMELAPSDDKRSSEENSLDYYGRNDDMSRRLYPTGIHDHV